MALAQRALPAMIAPLLVLQLQDSLAGVRQVLPLLVRQVLVRQVLAALPLQVALLLVLQLLLQKTKCNIDTLTAYPLSSHRVGELRAEVVWSEGSGCAARSWSGGHRVLTSLWTLPCGDYIAFCQERWIVWPGMH